MKEKWKVSWDNKDSHLVKDYDYWHNIYISKRQEMLDVFTFVKNIYQPKALEILDIGCGTGAVSLNLLESDQNIHATLIDGSNPQLFTAQKKFEEKGYKGKFIYQDMNDKQWFAGLEKSYPLIVSNIMIHHLTDTRKREVFKDIHNLLFPKGVFIYGDAIKFADSILEDEVVELWTHDIRDSFLKNKLELKDFNDMKKELIEASNEQGDMPSTIKYIENALKSAGFKTVFMIWFYIKFAVFVAIK